MTRSVEVRDALVKTLQLDLVGPGPGHPLESEQLWESEPPSRWYLTGFLVPTHAPEHLRFDPESAEVIDGQVGGQTALETTTWCLTQPPHGEYSCPPRSG